MNRGGNIHRKLSRVNNALTSHTYYRPRGHSKIITHQMWQDLSLIESRFKCLEHCKENKLQITRFHLLLSIQKTAGGWTEKGSLAKHTCCNGVWHINAHSEGPPEWCFNCSKYGIQGVILTSTALSDSLKSILLAKSSSGMLLSLTSTEKEDECSQNTNQQDMPYQDA